MIPVLDIHISNENEYFIFKQNNAWFALYLELKYRMASTSFWHPWKVDVKYKFQVTLDATVRNQIFNLLLSDDNETLCIIAVEPLYFAEGYCGITNFKVETSSLEFVEYIEVIEKIT